VSQTTEHTMEAGVALAPRAVHGYTLVELITVMTIVGILIGIGVPSYRYVTNSSRVSGEINQLLADMQYARSEAIKQGTGVTVCPGTVTGTNPAITGTCATSGTNWHTGWFVFVDLHANGTFDTGDQVLKVQPAFTSKDTLVFSGDSAVTAITFNREGFTTNIPLSDSTNGTGLIFKLNTQPTNVQWERCLTIGFVGLMSTQRGTTDTTQPCS